MPVATRWPLVGRRDELDVFTEALHDPGCQACCIYGPSGVGKTRLGEEYLAVAEVAGRRVLRAAADHADSVVPLAAVAHLLIGRALTDWQDGDDGGSIGRTRLLDRARRSLAPTADESGKPVLLLDDAHRVDRSSLTVVDHLLTHGAVFGIATVNSDEPVPEIVTHWWREERAIRIELGGLDSVGVDTLLHVVLEGALEGRAATDLWAASQGNLLVLHELVLEALSKGSLSCRDGVWYLDGRLRAPDRLRDVIAQRIAGLTSEGRGVLELLAMCQPVGLFQLEASFGLDVLEELEREGMVVIRADGRRHTVSLAHPLHREVVRAAIPPAHARTILLKHAETLEAYGARRRDDPVHIATLQLEATGQADPDLLLRAARVARFDHDFANAARLARASIAARPTAIGGLVLGEALHNLGSFDDAESALATAMDRPPDGHSVAIATMRRRNLFVGCRLVEDAVTVGRIAASGDISASARAELMAGEAEILAYSGKPREALALLEQVEVSEARLDVLAASARAPALAMTGRTADALALSDRGRIIQQTIGDQLALPMPGTHNVTELFALVQAGRLAEADERGRTLFDAAVEKGARLELMWLAVHLARCALARGLPNTALRWADRATNAIDAHRFEGLRPIATAIRAAAHGLLGDAAASKHAADDVDRLRSGFGAFAVELPLARAWALVADGELRSASDLLLVAASDAERAGFVPAAAWLWHDAARLGGGDAAARPLPALAAVSDSSLVHLRAEHVAALIDGDGARLEAVSAAFAAIGAAVLAAEAAADGADAWRQRRDERQATELGVRADELAARCEGAKTPTLTRARMLVALSERERDVAMVAADGGSSRAIAEELSLSVRTVDNHLGRIYSKLGVSGRDELTAALARGMRKAGRP